MQTIRDPKTGLVMTVPDEVAAHYVASRGPAEDDSPVPAEPQTPAPKRKRTRKR